MDLLGITSMYEPVSNSDLIQQMEVAKLLKRLTVEKGTFAIMKCHDVDSKFSDVIVLLSGSSVYAAGASGMS